MPPLRNWKSTNTKSEFETRAAAKFGNDDDPLKTWTTEMHCIAKTPAQANEEPKSSSAIVELDGVIRQKDGKLRVYFSSSRNRSWQIDCTARQIQTFPKFQVRVADHCGVWIDHWSQESTRAEARRRDWQQALENAFGRGPAK